MAASVSSNPAVSAPVATAVPAHHPKGLRGLFFTEMWERFSYYGMRALLVGYLVQYHGWQPSDASAVYKWYTSLVYLTPLLGGMLADRYLGLRSSIIIGATLMAIGHFLMAFEPLPVFYTALAFLIAGNGFFKPNISTLVGRMYFKNDSRRDAAFTIFYMAINLGAFLSPIVCGWLRVHMNQGMGYHWGFSAAGVGMVLGLAWFLLNQKQIIRDVEATGNSLALARDQQQTTAAASTTADEQAAGAGGVAGVISKVFPLLFALVGLALPVWYLVQYLQAGAGARASDLIMPAAYGAVFVWMSVTLLGLRGAARDKSTAIFIFFLFAVLFWMAFEQAGNALNIWAIFNTDLSLGSWTYPAEWWQSMNAILIVAFAPPISWLWRRLGRYEPSTPAKMLIGLGCMVLAFAVMVVGARVEDRTTTRIDSPALPPFLLVDAAEDGRLHFDDAPDERVHAGRLYYQPVAEGQGQLAVQGVLPHYVVNDILHRSAPEGFRAQMQDLEAATRDASAERPVTIEFPDMPAGYRPPYTPEELQARGIAVDPAARRIRFDEPPNAPTRGELLAGAAQPELRDTLWQLEAQSKDARVSGIWLFLEYMFATLGELCLSPVGLSMVTKLAPLRFASLFMGVWLLSNSVAQYAGGSIGESWGIVPPVQYFTLFVVTSLAGFVALALLLRPIRRLMHDVH
ncbi:MAG: MFS transporter [Planctomycetota bacterium]|nr:MAG: MFS transporter [Planctomycetota bacterium]